MASSKKIWKADPTYCETYKIVTKQHSIKPFSDDYHMKRNAYTEVHWL